MQVPKAKKRKKKKKPSYQSNSSWYLHRLTWLLVFLSLISINIILPVLELCINRIIQDLIFNSFYFYMVSMKNTWYEYGIIFLSFLLLFKLFSVFGYFFSAVQFSSVAQSCPTPSDPMDCSMPGFSVHHQLPELSKTHIHWVGDAI